MMMYDTLLARSFSKHEQKRLGYGALFATLFITLSFFTILKPYLGPNFPVLNLRLSMGDDQKLQFVNETTNSSDQLIVKEIITNETSIAHDAIASTNKEIVSENIITEEFEVENSSADAGSSHHEIVNATITNTTTVLGNDFVPTQEIAKEDADVVKMNKTDQSKYCTFLQRSEFCEINGEDIRIDGKSSKVSVVTSETDISAAENTSWSIKPYARKGDQAAMSNVREWSVKLVANGADATGQCSRIHRVPAILFSMRGYAGNHFHAFTDIIVPLFATARPFNGEVQFLVTDKVPWWINKFQTLLKALSRYEIIGIDESEDIHCFSSVTVGLKARPDHKELSIDPSRSSYSMKDFKDFLRSAYSLKKTTAIKVRDGDRKKPRLLIISRKWSRAFTNVDEIARMARRLGYKVVIGEPDRNVARFAQIMNSCDVVMGVHGAGLTNIVFLPERAVLIQIIPFGGAEWVSKAYFQDPLEDMGLRYLDYKIKVEESTLIEQYPPDDVVLRDPRVIGRQGWEAFKTTYFDKQNVKLDVNRFRPTLSKALELLHSEKNKL